MAIGELYSTARLFAKADFATDEPSTKEVGWARTFIAWTAIQFTFQLTIIAWHAPTLTDPDEALFANVAREMLQSGDFITPRDAGKPFLDRPILHYWFLCGSTALFGDNDLAFRLPGFILGLVTVVAVGCIARDLFGPQIAAATAYLYASCVGAAVLAIMVGHDSSLVCFVALAAWTGLRSLDPTRRATSMRYAAATGVLMGMGCLAKGLLGIVLPALAMLAAALVFTWRKSVVPLSFAVVIALASAAPWYLAAERSNPGYMREFVVGRHLLGYLTGSQRHGDRSVLVYLPTLAAGFLPWTILQLRPAVKGARRLTIAERTPAPTQFALVWTLMTIGFFVCSRSRNPIYMAPALLPLAILGGKGLSTHVSASGRWARWVIPSVSLVNMFVLAFGLVVAMPHVAEWRSARSIAQFLDRQPQLPQPVLWFNSLPPSARHYAPHVAWQRVTMRDIEAGEPFGEPFGEPLRPTILVMRESRLAEAPGIPLVRRAAHLEFGGKYHVFWFDPRNKPASLVAGGNSLNIHSANRHFE